MTQADKLLTIMNHYGATHQLKYMYTEFFEFTEAVIAGDREHITEEFSDLMVMLSQFRELYELDPEKIESVMNFKIDRQLNRISGELNNDLH